MHSVAKARSECAIAARQVRIAGEVDAAVDARARAAREIADARDACRLMGRVAPLSAVVTPETLPVVEDDLRR